MDTTTLFEPQIDFSTEQFFKKKYSDIITQGKKNYSDIITQGKKNILNSYIALNIEEHAKFYINMFLFAFIFIANLVLIIKRNTNKDDKEFIEFFNDLYHDLLKYLIIETALVVSEAIEANEFNISKSLARVSIVLIALIIFHNIKGKFGLH